MYQTKNYAVQLIKAIDTAGAFALTFSRRSVRIKNVVCLAVLLSCAAMCPRLVGQDLKAIGSGQQGNISVILSTDIGNEIDDQWAIAYLLTNPKFNVFGIVSANAPSLPAPSAHSTYFVLRDEVENRLGMKVHPPLFEGSSLPLQDITTPRLNSGTNFIVEESRHFTKDNRLIVLTIGAATDVASAILQDPTIVNRISIVAMAFTNHSASGGKEFNVENDVKAWQVLLNSDVPIAIGSGDVCRANLALNFEQAKDLLGGHGAIGGWLWSEYDAWYYRNVKPLRVNDFSKPWIIWDIITLAYVQNMATGETLPRPQLGDDLSLTPTATGRTVTWITAVDSKRMWSDFVKTVDNFQRRHAIGNESSTDSLILP
jgi:purine nucleosidase